MSGTMKILKWIRKKVMAEVEFTSVQKLALIGRYDKACFREALDQIEGDQVFLTVARNYDGRNIPALCVYAPGGVSATVAVVSVDEKTGKDRKLQE